MSVVTQLYFQIVEGNNYMFRPFSWWVIIRLRLEYWRKLIYYNVNIKHGERDLVLQCLGRSVAIYMRCGLCDVHDFICHVFCKFIDTFKDDSSPRVDEPTEDTTNKAVNIADCVVLCKCVLCLVTSSLNTARPSTIFYRLLLN
jgi:hypothetical protein